MKLLRITGTWIAAGAILFVGIAIGYMWKGKQVEPPAPIQPPAFHKSGASSSKPSPITEQKVVKDSQKDVTEVASKNNETDLPIEHPSSDSEHEHPIIEVYSREKPLLIGIGMDDSVKDVVAKLGEPNDKIELNDPDDPLTIYKYIGFTVGFNEADEVQFVEVSSGSVDPGLNGLRVGQTYEDVIKALGKPDTNTEYVLSYNAEQTTLRLDVDPKSTVVQSIKFYPTP